MPRTDKALSVLAAATVVATAASAFLTAAAASSASPQLGFKGYGASRWGQTVAATEHALGTTFDCSGTCICPIASSSLPNTKLGFVNGRLDTVFTYDSSVRTARGVHPGSTLASARAAYPHAKRASGPIGGSPTSYLLAKGKGGVLAFEISGTSVAGIDAGHAVSSFSSEVC